jgi:hypothetical protein
MDFSRLFPRAAKSAKSRSTTDTAFRDHGELVFKEDGKMCTQRLFPVSILCAT